MYEKIERRLAGSRCNSDGGWDFNLGGFARGQANSQRRSHWQGKTHLPLVSESARAFHGLVWRGHDQAFRRHAADRNIVEADAI